MVLCRADRPSGVQTGWKGDIHCLNVRISENRGIVAESVGNILLRRDLARPRGIATGDGNHLGIARVLDCRYHGTCADVRATDDAPLDFSSPVSSFCLAGCVE